MALEKAALSSVVHVIDDDEALRESLTFLLRSARLDVQSYPSARAFIDVLPALTLSCVITDLRMADMSGIELVQHLKKLKIEAPVIASSMIIDCYRWARFGDKH
jgi:two-component system, LuxR family, response regulator FixJ